MAKDDGVQAEAARVVQHVLVGGALGAAVGCVELNRSGLVHSGLLRARLVARGGLDEVEVIEVAVDLVAGGVDDGRLRSEPANGLQHIDGADDVGIKVTARVLHGGRHGHLAGEMEHDLGLQRLDGMVDSCCIADVLVQEVERAERAQPRQVLGGAVADERVEDGDARALREQMCGEVGADEARSTGDQCLHGARVSLSAGAEPSRASRFAAAAKARSLRSVLR